MVSVGTVVDEGETQPANQQGTSFCNQILSSVSLDGMSCSEECQEGDRRLGKEEYRKHRDLRG